MVVYRNGHGPLCVFLTHNILRQLIINLMRRREVLNERLVCGGVTTPSFFKLKLKRIVNHVTTSAYALIADTNTIRTLNELVYLTATLATEGTTHLLVIKGETLLF